MEKLDELHNNSGDAYDYGARMYDARLGRWMSPDPLFKSQPGWSPYKSFLNNPIIFEDKAGKTEYQVNITIDAKSGKAAMEIKTANSVMTDGIKHNVSSWYDADWHQEVAYYDYATVNVTTINTDGSITQQTATKILYENGVKDTDISWMKTEAGETKTESWLTGKDYGKEVSFGIDFGSEGGTDGPVAKDFSKNAIVSGISYSELASAFKASTKGLKGTNYKVGSGSWQKLPKGAKGWIEFVKSKAEGGSKIGEIVNKTKDLLKQDSLICPTCHTKQSVDDTAKHNEDRGSVGGYTEEKKK
ncbi:MAG: hypothetical protein A3F72_09635 [Bacteroidetes bacterium RIFCSPLOWO2_12_FULL_35_15]|nr:MAG: hypothetical protein A3F72_09635 [Bacteroidetes bacterium RIFCSPLOWO2_12_FULL_35_15]